VIRIRRAQATAWRLTLGLRALLALVRRGRPALTTNQLDAGLGFDFDAERAPEALCDASDHLDRRIRVRVLEASDLLL